jgi:endonuclease/exonuclease/phosphatase (EEP) superfamily protein YafD
MRWLLVTFRGFVSLGGPAVSGPSRLLDAVLVLILGPLLIIASLRLVAHDQAFPLVLLNAYTFWLYTPAYAAFLGALLARSRLLAVAALLVIGFHVWWVAPDYLDGRDLPRGAEAWPQLTVFSINLSYDNPDFGPIMQEALASDADLLFFQEFTPGAQSALEAARIPERYPHRAGEARPEAAGNAVFSRVPLEEGDTWLAAGMPMTRVVVRAGGQPVTLFGVHTSAPIGSAWVRAWDRELGALVQAARESGPRVVMAGDFNMTQHHRPYGQLMDAGLHDAYRDAGKGRAATWPNGNSPWPPIRLDQVMLGRDVFVVSIRNGAGKGSDHKPIVVKVAIRP